MINKRKPFGKAGEDSASAYLKKKGYRILCRNFRCKAGEIDIIAEDNNIVVFVEVKTRSGNELGTPVTALTPQKQKKITAISRSFLASHKVDGRQCRFDVVSVTGHPDHPDSWEIKLLQDAFRPGI